MRGPLHPVDYVSPSAEHAHSLVLAVAIAFDGYRSFAPPGWQPPDELTPENVERVAGEIADPANFALMAVHEGDPVGHVLWVAREDHIHLRHLFVLEPWWGTDVARTLHARAVEAMAGRPARLYTPAFQQRARRFYEREDWRLHGVQENELFGAPIAEYRRELPGWHDPLMSQDELAVVRSWSEGMQRGEVRTHLWSPDAGIENARGWVVDATYHGREGVRRWWDDLADAIDDMTMHAVHEEAVGDGRVLTKQHVRGRFRTSGIQIDVPWYSVLTIREGLIVHAVGYLSEREAREALG